MLLLVSTALTSALAAAPAAAPAAPSSVAPTDSYTLLLRGFDLVWERRPHRVRALGVGFDMAEGASGSMWADVMGGTWASGESATDEPVLGVRYDGLATSARPLCRGTVTLDITGSAAGGKRARQPAEGVQHVHVDGCGGAAAAVWLSGFSLHTSTDHPVGYTVHALEVDTTSVRATPTGIDFDLRVRVEAAPVPDREQDLADYGAHAIVGWVAVGAAPEEVHEHTFDGSVEKGLALAADASQVASVSAHDEWSTSAPGVVAALSGFSVHLDEEGAMDGRYLRALTVDLVTSALDPFRRLWAGDAALRFSNLGQVSRPVRAEMEAHVTALALRAGERTWSGRWWPQLDAQGNARVAWPG